MPRKLLPLAFVLAFVAAACAEPPETDVDLGSGVRFVPEVADPLNDAGRHASVALGPDGLPVIAYFGFLEELEEGEVPPPRPIGSPSLPSVMLAGVSAEGYWTRGAIAMTEQIANVAVAFNPAFEPTVADLTPQSVTGLDLVTEGDTYHAAWASVAGVYYATGSLDPATATQATVSLVSSAPGLGLSLALDDSGTPWIAYYTSTSSVGTVDLATPDGDGWRVDTIAEGGGCETCATAVVAGPAGPSVVFSEGGVGVSIASNDGGSGWSSVRILETGGQGLSAVATTEAVEIASYDGTTVSLTTLAGGAAESVAVAEVADGSADAEGAGTDVAAGASGDLAIGWVDSGSGVGFAVRSSGAVAAVGTAGSTAGGTFPSVAVAEEPATSYLGWYDTEGEDALVGGYGDIGDIPIAEPSPTSTEPIAPPAPPPSQECTPVEGGTVTVVAEGIAFTDGSCIEVAAGESFTIAFDNRDAGTQHNIQIFDDPEPTANLLFEGEIITGPAQIEYKVPAFDTPGEYAFSCVVHPNMLGSIQVVEGAAGGGGAAGAAPTVTASNLQFDVATIELAAGEATTITFVNEDSGVQHNIAIYQDDTLAVELFNGELVTGPAEIVYEIPPLEAGEYYFLCIVHPNMNGTVVVS